MDKRVRELGDIAKRNREGRAQDELRGRALRDRRKEVDDAKLYAQQGFWCKECARDFSAQGLKQVRDYDTWPLAWYGALCPNGHTAIRRITDKLHDPYFYESQYIRREQAQHADDFMLPSDPRFRYKYPVQWARIEEERRQREEVVQPPHA